MALDESLTRRLRIYKELGVDFEGDEPVSLFALLAISEDETDAKMVAKAYRKQSRVLLSKKAKKDRPSVEAIQAELDRAYEILKDEERRTAYRGYQSLEDRRAKLATIRGIVGSLPKTGLTQEVYDSLAQRVSELNLDDEGGSWLDAHLKTLGVEVESGKEAGDDPWELALGQAAEAGRVPYEVYLRLLRFGEALGRSEAEIEISLDELVRRKAWKVEREPPEPEPTPEAPDPIESAIEFCGLDGQISHRELTKILALAEKLGRNEQALRDTLRRLAAARDWTIEWQAPAPARSVQEKLDAARPVPPESGPPKLAPGKPARKAITPRRSSEASTSRPVRPSASRRRVTRASSGGAPTASGKSRPPRRRAAVEGRPTGLRGAIPGGAFELFFEGIKQLERGVEAHQDLREFFPPWNGLRRRIPVLEGVRYEDCFLAEVEAYRSCHRLLEEAAGAAIGSPGEEEFIAHLRRIDERLERYVEDAETLDAGLMGVRNEGHELELWGDYLDRERSTEETALPELARPRAPRRESPPERHRPETRVIAIGRIEAPAEGLGKRRGRRPKSRIGVPLGSGREGRSETGKIAQPRPASGRLRRPTAADRHAEPPRERRRSPGQGNPAPSRPLPSSARRLGGVRLFQPLSGSKARRLGGLALGRQSAAAVFSQNGRVSLLGNPDGKQRSEDLMVFGQHGLRFGLRGQELSPEQAEGRVERYLEELGKPDFRREIFERTYSAEVLTGIYIASLFREASDELKSVTDVVIAAPAGLPPAGRAELAIAARVAGANLLDVIDPATALAVAAQHGDGELELPALFVHAGAVSLDLALVTGEDGLAVTRLVEGCTSLGGYAWAEAIRDELVESYRDARGSDPLRSPSAAGELLQRSWEALTTLREAGTVEILIGAGAELHRESITKSRFQRLTRSRMKELRDLVPRLLRRGLIGSSELKSVRLGGFPELTEIFYESLEEEFGRRLRLGSDWTAGVARGALLWAARMTYRSVKHSSAGTVEDLRGASGLERVVPVRLHPELARLELRRVASQSLSICVEETAGTQLHRVLEQGSSIPAQVSESFFVTGPAMGRGAVLPRRGGGVLIQLRGGEAEDVEDCPLVAELLVPDPHMIRDRLELELRLGVGDARFIIDVSDPATGELLLSEEIDTGRHPGSLSDRLVRRWRADLSILESEGPGALGAL